MHQTWLIKQYENFPDSRILKTVHLPLSLQVVTEFRHFSYNGCMPIDAQKFCRVKTKKMQFSHVWIENFSNKWGIFIARSGYQPGREIWNLLPKIGIQTFLGYSCVHNTITQVNTSFWCILFAFLLYFRTFNAHLCILLPGRNQANF